MTIKIGKFFDLGDRYHYPRQPTFHFPEKRRNLFHMGCYGIMVPRLLDLFIEQSHDVINFIWPTAMHPFMKIFLPSGCRDAELSEKALRIAGLLEERFPEEVLVDDRDLRAGVKFADADLCGFPIQVILGEKGLRENRAEIKVRSSGERNTVDLSALSEWIADHLGSGGAVDTGRPDA